MRVHTSQPFEDTWNVLGYGEGNLIFYSTDSRENYFGLAKF